MNKEQLQKAVDLENSINKLKDHQETLLKDNKWDKIKYQAMTLNENHIRDLLPLFMPLPVVDFKLIYLSKLDAKIKELEKEFNSL